MNNSAYGLILGTILEIMNFAPIEAQESKIIFTEKNTARPTAAQSRLWIINSDGSELEKLADSVSTSTRQISKALFSPDGNMITFQSTDGMQKIINLKGEILYEFKGGGRSDEDFVWTLDGKKILCGKYVDGLYEFNLEKDTLIKIRKTNGYTYDHNPVFSPDMKKIIFTHHAFESYFFNYLWDATGTKLITSSTLSGVRTGYDEQLDLTWMTDSTMLFRVPSKKIISYYNINSGEGKNFLLSTAFRTIEVSEDKNSVAVIPTLTTEKLSFADISSMTSDTLRLKSTNLDNVVAMAYSADNKIFCISKGGKELYTFDGEMNKHLLLKALNPADSIGTIEFIDWDSKPVKASDLGEIEGGPTAIQKIPESVLKKYPNPFNSIINLEYELNKNSDVILRIYSISGRKESEIVEKNRKPGAHILQYDGSKLNTGIYIYQLQTGDKVSSGRIVKQ